jgi:hypothetical protein
MLIAKIDGSNITVADYKVLFPNTSFPASGPSADWMAANSCMPVNMWLPYDQDTQKLVPAQPYIDGEWVYTVVVEELTPEEIEQRQASQKAQVKAQAASLLQQTDWVELGDVSDPANPPYLENKAEFTTYRAALRAIAVNPPVTVSEWPTKA